MFTPGVLDTLVLVLRDRVIEGRPMPSPGGEYSAPESNRRPVISMTLDSWIEVVSIICQQGYRI